MSRSGYYKHKKAAETEKSNREIAVIKCFKKYNANYGRVRIKRALKKEGIIISENAISKLMKKNGLVAKSGRTGRKKPERPTEQQYIEQNLLTDKFAVTAANELWCSDITVLKCRNYKVYLCGVIDVATRRIVGWAIDKTQTQVLVQDAFKMALGRNPSIPYGAVYHSDRGCQYTAKKTKELVESSGFRKSMSRPGTPSDNQPIESFWRTLECEMEDISTMKFNDAKRTIVSFIEMYYNSERIHSGIDYITPNEKFILLSVH